MIQGSDIEIKRAENGYIVLEKPSSRDMSPPLENAYVFTTPKALANWVEEHYTSQGEDK